MLKKLLEMRGKLHAQIDEMRKALDAKGTPETAEERAAWDKLLADYNANEAAIAAEKRKSDTEKAFAVESAGIGRSDEREARSREIFRNILLRGGAALSDLTPEEKRTTLDATAGTYLMPTTIADRVEVALLASGGMMEACDIIRTAKGETLNLPTLNDTSRKASIIAAYSDGAGRSKLTFGNVALGAFTYRSALIPLSYELIQDSYFDIEQLVIDQLTESFARGMNEHFTTSAADASATPKGIVAAANNVNAAGAALTADDLLSLMSGVNSAYWQKARWMFNAKTLVAIMKLKDEEGRFIWQPDMANGARATIFGHEYVLNADMDDVAASKKPVLFGDFSKYKIRIVRGLSFRRLEELLAEFASIGIFGFCRADGALVDAGTHPVAKLTIAAGSGSGSGQG